jgi:hypothetical protein
MLLTYHYAYTLLSPSLFSLPLSLSLFSLLSSLSLSISLSHHALRYTQPTGLTVHCSLYYDDDDALTLYSSLNHWCSVVCVLFCGCAQAIQMPIYGVRTSRNVLILNRLTGAEDVINGLILELASINDCISHWCIDTGFVCLLSC